MGEYHAQSKATNQKSSISKLNSSTVQSKQNGLSGIIQMAKINPTMLTQNDVMVLQRTIGNQAVCQMFSSSREDNNQESNQINGDNNIFQRREITKEEDTVQMEKENKTGIPDNLKVGVESQSGISMDDIKVHYNSDKPKQLGALAYTQGTEIHVGPGQEKHLGHELGHVVQQKQGRVNPTTKVNGVDVNDDEKLEKEADTIQMKSDLKYNNKNNVVQCMKPEDRPQKPLCERVSEYFNIYRKYIKIPLTIFDDYDILEMEMFNPNLRNDSNDNYDNLIKLAQLYDRNKNPKQLFDIFDLLDELEPKIKNNDNLLGAIKEFRVELSKEIFRLDSSSQEDYWEQQGKYGMENGESWELMYNECTLPDYRGILEDQLTKIRLNPEIQNYFSKSKEKGDSEAINEINILLEKYDKKNNILKKPKQPTKELLGKFNGKITKAIDVLASIETGKKLLEYIYLSKSLVSISPTYNLFGAANLEGNNGVGTEMNSVSIQINYDADSLGEIENQVIVLAHELIHTLHAIYGVRANADTVRDKNLNFDIQNHCNDDGIYKGATPDDIPTMGIENNVVDYGALKNQLKGDTDTDRLFKASVQGINYAEFNNITENKIREELSAYLHKVIPQRTKY